MPPTICSQIRCKKLFIPEQAADAVREMEEGGVGEHFWCNRTANALGPDDLRVNPQVCGPDRKCFEQ